LRTRLRVRLSTAGGVNAQPPTTRSDRRRNARGQIRSSRSCR
jgi:hypothetical protein